MRGTDELADPHALKSNLSMQAPLNKTSYETTAPIVSANAKYEFSSILGQLVGLCHVMTCDRSQHPKVLQYRQAIPNSMATFSFMRSTAARYQQSEILALSS